MKKYFCFILIIFGLMIITVSCNKDDIESPGTGTGSPGVSMTPKITDSTDNIEPTNTMSPSNITPATSSKINVGKLTDDELRDEIAEAAKKLDYNVYDIRNSKRAVADNKVPTVDIEQTLNSVRENNDMSSTRFVFKGGRMADTKGLERIAEYSTPLLSKSEEAVNNIKVANKKLNGIILRPDEEYSFSFLLGKQTEEDGYKEATIYVKEEGSNEVEEEKALGGGICQVSSTIHAACLELDLKIVERHEHSKKVSYIEKGKDATISGDYYDLKFVNNLKHSIVICLKIEDKKEIAEIYRLDVI